MIVKTQFSEGEQPLEPIITIDREEIERRRGMAGPPVVAQIRIKNQRGEYGIFHVAAGFSDLGRPYVVLENCPDNEETNTVRKKVFGACDRS